MSASILFDGSHGDLRPLKLHPHQQDFSSFLLQLLDRLMDRNILMHAIELLAAWTELNNLSLSLGAHHIIISKDFLFLNRQASSSMLASLLAQGCCA